MSQIQLEQQVIPGQALHRHNLLFTVTAILLTGLFILPILPSPSFPVPGWIAWVGRFHPVIVHFPLALVPLLVLIELCCYLRPLYVHRVAPAIYLFWLLAVASAVVSVVLGYFLYGSGDYDGELVDDHFWGGVITTILIILAAFFSLPRLINLKSEKSARISPWYRATLAASFIGILYTGHHGGMLTHGSTFLTEALPINQGVTMADKPREALLVFDDLIFPILEERCVSCHNANKTRGGLEMTSFLRMQNGGDSGNPLFVAHQPLESELYKRITLPAHDDDHMPPDGKTPLNQTEINLVSWWIEQGASQEQQFGAGPVDASINMQTQRLIDNRLVSLNKQKQKQQEIEETARVLEAAFRTLIVEPDPSTKNTSLVVSMKIPPMHVDDNVVSALVSQTDQITRLSLVGSDITDDALFHISRLPELRDLFLAYTRIDGTGLAYFQNTPSLQLLNLAGTRVTNDAALHLTRMPALEEVYLHNTKVDSVMVEALKAFLPNVEVSVGVGPLY